MYTCQRPVYQSQYHCDISSLLCVVYTPVLNLTDKIDLIVSCTYVLFFTVVAVMMCESDT